MAKTGSQVAAWAKSQADRRTGGWVGLCLKFSRMAAGAPGGTYDAHTGWRNAKYKHTKGTPPRGAIVWWHGGKHGHVAVSAGDGYCYSTDVVVRGQVRRCKISLIRQRWGQTYVGWSEDVNGVRISGLVKSNPTVPASAMRVENIKDQWYHVDPKKVTTGLNWYSSKYVKRGVRPRNFNVLVVGTSKHNGHTYAVTGAGNKYRMDYLAKGRA
jgi:hypothetical protein